jgi:imidazoleglycerol phosphate synthase glutamine amidotransferase subunit HisH
VTGAAGLQEPPVGVLALQGDVAEHQRALAALGVAAVQVRRAEELDSISGLIIPGGESTTMWKLATAFDLLEPIRKLVGAGLPAFGCCAGMIMLADRIADGAAGQETFGGIDMTVRRTSNCGEWMAPRCALYSSGLRGWKAPGPALKCSAPTPPPVGSSRSDRAGC